MAITCLVISTSLSVIETFVSVVIISVRCGCKLIAQAIVLLLFILTGFLTLLGFMPPCTVAALVLVLPHLKFLRCLFSHLESIMELIWLRFVRAAAGAGFRVRDNQIRLILIRGRYNQVGVRQSACSIVFLLTLCFLLLQLLFVSFALLALALRLRRL